MNIADNHGFTALHLAVFHKHEAAVKCLLDRGASANCRTADGKTVRDMVYGMKSSERYETRVRFPMRKKLNSFSFMVCCPSFPGFRHCLTLNKDFFTCTTAPQRLMLKLLGIFLFEMVQQIEP